MPHHHIWSTGSKINPACTGKHATNEALSTLGLLKCIYCNYFLFKRPVSGNSVVKDDIHAGYIEEKNDAKSLNGWTKISGKGALFVSLNIFIFIVFLTLSIFKLWE